MNQIHDILLECIDAMRSDDLDGLCEAHPQQNPPYPTPPTGADGVQESLATLYNGDNTMRYRQLKEAAVRELNEDYPDWDWKPNVNDATDEYGMPATFHSSTKDERRKMRAAGTSDRSTAARLAALEYMDNEAERFRIKLTRLCNSYYNRVRECGGYDAPTMIFQTLRSEASKWKRPRTDKPPRPLSTDGLPILPRRLTGFW